MSPEFWLAAVGLFIGLLGTLMRMVFVTGVRLTRIEETLRHLPCNGHGEKCPVWTHGDDKQ